LRYACAAPAPMPCDAPVIIATFCSEDITVCSEDMMCS
jgi:hypothetical protein